MPQKLRVLIVEDSENDTLMMLRELKQGGYKPQYERVDIAGAMEAALDKQEWDIILADYCLPKFSGIEALSILKNKGLDLPFIVISGSITDDTAVAAMKAGAHDYIMKDNMKRLVPAIRRELEDKSVRQERKQAEEELKRREELLNNIIEQTPNALFISDEKGTIIRMNQALRDLLKIKDEEIIGKYNALKDTQVIEQGNLPLIKSVFEEGKTVRFKLNYNTAKEKQVTLAETTYRVLELVVSPIKDKEGRVIHAIFQEKDITEQEKAKAALIESEQRYRNLFESTGAATLLVEEDMTVAIVNAELERLSGYSKEELEGKRKWTEFVVKEDLERLKQYHQLRRLDSQAVTKQYECRLLNKQGGIINALMTVDMVPETRRSIVSFVDITGRKKAEEALRQSEEKYRTILKIALDGFTIDDLKGRLVEVNDSYCKMMGYTREELLAMSIPEIEALEQPEDTGQHIKKIMGQGYDRFETRQKRKDGKIIDLEISANYVDVEGGQLYVFARDITERKRVQEMLRTSEERYRSLFENAPIGIVVSVEGKALLCNNKVIELFGLKSPSDMVGHNVYGFVQREDLQVIQQMVKNIGNGHKADFPVTYRGIRPDGKELFVETIGIQFPSLGENVVLSFHTDVTERKKAEDALLRERNKAQQYLAIAGVMIVAIDADQKVSLINKKGCQLLGYEEKDILGKNWFDNFVPADVRKNVRNVFSMLVAGVVEPVEYFENAVLASDGQERTIAWHNIIIKDDRGVITGTLSSGDDITERRKAQQALQQSEQKYRQLVELAQEGIWAIDAESRTTFTNPKMAQMLGYTEEEMQGRSLFSFMGEQGVALAKHLVERRKSGILEEHDFEFIRKDGTSLYAALNTSPILDEKGNYNGALAVVVDMTKRRQAEEARLKADEAFHRSMDESPLGIRIVTSDGDTVYANQAILDIYGYSNVEEYKTVPKEKLYTPEGYTEHLVRKMKRKRGEYVPSRYEISIVRKNGETRHLEVLRKEVIWNDKLHYQVLYQDITERKRAEEALRQSEEKFVKAFRSSPFLFSITKLLDGRYIEVNDSFLHETGYTREEVVGHTSLGIGLWAKPEQRSMIVRKIQENKKVQNVEVDLRIKSGRILKGLISAEPIMLSGEMCLLSVVQDITERKRAEEALRESEERYRRLAENAPDVIVRYELLPQRRYAFISRAATAVFGYTPEEFYADPKLTLKIAHPENLDTFKSIGRGNAGLEMPELMRWIRKDGVVIWVEQHSIPIYDAEGKLVAIESICRDITARKQAEDALEESEDRFRRLAENAPDIILRYELLPKRRYSFVSTAITAISGYTPEEYYADPDLAFKIVYPDDMVSIRSVDRQRIQESTPRVIRFVRKNGTLAWVEQNSMPIYDKEANLVAIEAVIRDITERKRAEDLLATITTSSPIGIYIARDGKFLYVNPRFIAFTGYSEQELLTRDISTLVFSEDVEKSKNNAIAMLKGKLVTPYQFRYVTKGGVIKWALERVTSFDYQGKQTVLGSFMDITQNKLMEEEIRRKELEAAAVRETDRLKDQLLSTVSHELRTPLASIKGYCTLLLDYSTKMKANEKRESMEAIDKSSDRLTELIDRLLDMSRLEVGLLKMIKSPADILAIIERAVYEASLRAPEYRISAKVEKKLPRVNIDGRRIRQVVDNLMDNAIKYSPKHTEIVVKAWQEDDKLLVSVADQGIGIPAEEFDKIFDRMYRIEQRLSVDPGGMGLGLSLCKALVENHGGRIWLESKVGKGSTFYFSLPIETKGAELVKERGK